MARVILGVYSNPENERLNQSRYRPRAFDVHYQSDRNRVYRPSSHALNKRGLTHTMTGNIMFRRSACGNATAGSTWATGSADPAYIEAVNYYADKAGGPLGDAARRVGVTIDKGMAVATDVGIGAGIGAMVPILGELGIGEGVGAVIGAIYGVFDNFGDDIKDFFNPPDFEESDYNRMRKNCLRSGGLPNPGHAPDNQWGCIYPDGTTSGGDYPRHPPPGVREIRGDNFFDYDAWYAAHPELDPSHAADPYLSHALPPPLSTGPVAKRILMVKKGQSSMLPPVALHETVHKVAMMRATSTRPTTPVRAAMVTVGKALAGDSAAAVDVRSTVDAARAGDASAITAARLMTHAQRLIMIQSFTEHYNPSHVTSGVASGYGTGGIASGYGTGNVWGTGATQVKLPQRQHCRCGR